MKQKNRSESLTPVLLLIFILSCNQPKANDSTTENKISVEQTAVRPQPELTDTSMLTGSWVRTDAPYRLEISAPGKDGKIQAAYFNPKSINVEKATWVDNASNLKISVVLRDANYPGSKYDLVYVKERDVLAGAYYQAVEGTTYQVEFVRKK